MNILDLNNKIYGYKDFKQGEYANFKIDSIGQQELLKFGNYDTSNEFGQITKEIKF